MLQVNGERRLYIAVSDSQERNATRQTHCAQHENALAILAPIPRNRRLATAASARVLRIARLADSGWDRVRTDWLKLKPAVAKRMRQRPFLCGTVTDLRNNASGYLPAKDSLKHFQSDSKQQCRRQPPGASVPVCPADSGPPALGSVWPGAQRWPASIGNHHVPHSSIHSEKHFRQRTVAHAASVFTSTPAPEAIAPSGIPVAAIPS